MLLPPPPPQPRRLRPLLRLTSSFEWLMSFLGQTDTSGCESSQVYFENVKSICNGYGSLWDSAGAVGTDGCHSMRSDRSSEGVDARGMAGDNFAAKFTTAVAPRKPLFFHSLCHIMSLAFGDALASALPSHWIRAVRLLSNYFARSAKRKHTARRIHATIKDNLDELAARFGDIYETHGWGMTFPKKYCATRWLGLAKSTKAAVQTWATLRQVGAHTRHTRAHTSTCISLPRLSVSNVPVR